MNQPTLTLSPPEQSILGQLVEAMALNDQTLFDQIIEKCSSSLRTKLISILFKLLPQHPLLRNYLSVSQKVSKGVNNIGNVVDAADKQRNANAAASPDSTDKDNKY